MKVLVVEDEEKIAQFLREGTGREGLFGRGRGGRGHGSRALEGGPYDLVILDLILPGSRDGIELCREIRARGIPSKMLMLTARDTVENKIEGLDAGADDYFVKPFSFRSCWRGIRALAAPDRDRGAGPAGLPGPELRAGIAGGRRGDETVRLTVREGALFELLLRRRGKVVSRSEIQARIWEDSFDLSTNIIDVYINALRSKLDAGEKERLIQTVRGVGYRLGEPGDPSPPSGG